jgi:glycosyltransferase involved in cell wall biosynthesis
MVRNPLEPAIEKIEMHQPPDELCPFASIIVPVYNGERTMRACLQSLLSQTYPPNRYEIIVVDNNSTDNTCSIVQEFPVTLLHENEIQTSYAARNRGVEAARGEIIAFTDADCIAAPNWLSELVTPFKELTVGGVGGQVLDSDPQSEVEQFICSLRLFARYQKDNSYLPVLMTNNAAYRRENLLALGSFNAQLYTGADIDLAWRLQLVTGNKVVYAPQAVIYHVHRSTLKSMARQFRRHGFGEIFLDAMYKDQPGYKRSPRRQVARMGCQFLALFTYGRSLLYRWLTRRLRPQDRMYMLTPLFWLVAEGSNLWGKILGLWATRFFRLNPAKQLWQDPGER